MLLKFRGWGRGGISGMTTHVLFQIGSATAQPSFNEGELEKIRTGKGKPPV